MSGARLCDSATLFSPPTRNREGNNTSTKIVIGPETESQTRRLAEDNPPPLGGDASAPSFIPSGKPTRCLAFRILNAAATEGIRVSAEDGGLRVSGPRDVLTPDVVRLIKSHKHALLALLTRRPVRSHVPGIVWDPRGGVRLEQPEDFPANDPTGTNAKQETPWTS